MKAVSEDGWECVVCDASTSLNAITKKCESCAGDDIINGIVNCILGKKNYITIEWILQRKLKT